MKHPDYYTLVQHSAWVAKYDPEFKHAVEEQAVTTEAERKRVIKAGGKLFKDYNSASVAAEDENYPPEVKGLIPRCRGTFAKEKVKGMPIYMPAMKGAA